MPPAKEAQTRATAEGKRTREYENPPEPEPSAAKSCPSSTTYVGSSTSAGDPRPLQLQMPQPKRKSAWRVQGSSSTRQTGAQKTEEATLESQHPKQPIRNLLAFIKPQIRDRFA